MFKEKFYNGSIRRYVIYFGTLFNNIEIDRVDNSGTVTQSIRVPVTYAPKEKFIAQLEQNPDHSKTVAIQLPRMSFEMTSFQYAAERRLNPNKRLYNTVSGNNSELRSAFTPTPFDIGFQLNVYVRNAEDGVRILEQILPYFTPEFTATLQLVDSMPDVKMDIPLVFQSLSTEDTYEGDFITRRALIHTLEFSMKGYIFGPVRERSGLIKLANTQFFVETGDTFNLDGQDVVTKVVAKPGLDANGNPTSNSSVSINTSSIAANSNYGYIIEKTFNG